MKISIFACALVLATPAIAQDLTTFQAPSGNIHCLIDSYGARCDILEANYSYSKRPADCDLDYGGAFYIDVQANRGEIGCVGDTVANNANPVLGYGSTLEAYGITCTSEQSGMTCTNPFGHGFSIARAKQSVF